MGLFIFFLYSFIVDEKTLLHLTRYKPRIIQSIVWPPNRLSYPGSYITTHVKYFENAFNVSNGKIQLILTGHYCVSISKPQAHFKIEVLYHVGYIAHRHMYYVQTVYTQSITYRRYIAR